ncbi:MAG: twin-arginine translocase subunit TatC [Sulfolobaceae archaeon]|nr:twin-arginine translocase subunit TatC [Sulfolobaceae archaeon]
METAKQQVDTERPLLEHIKELVFRLKRILISIGISFVIFFATGPSFITLYGYKIPIIVPSLYASFSDFVVRYFINRELPTGMKLISLNPLDPIFASIYVSLYLAIFISMPIILRELWAFVAPGLYEHEKKLIKKAILPGFGLFALGSAFAYFIIIPFMLIFVYRFDLVLGVEPTLSVRAYINTIVILMFATGLAFELPLIMAGLTYLGLVSYDGWKKNWRWGVLISFIIAWLISPGTTGGLIETTIGTILSLLYFAGVLVARYIERKNKSNKNQIITPLSAK